MIGGGIHLAIPLYNHYSFRTVAYDYAVYNFAFYDFAHLKVSPNPVYQIPYPVTFLQDHFSLLLPMLSPLYWIFAPVFGTYSLLIIQWIFVMAGGVCTHRFIRKLTSNGFLACASLATYFLIFGRFSAHRADCNLNIMVAALAPCLVLAFETRRLLPFAGLFALMAVTREDVSLWLLFLCVFFAVRHRTDRLLRNRAIIFAAISVAFFILVMWFIIPHFLEDENKKYSNFDYTALGGTPGAAIGFLFTRPLDAFKLLFVNHGEGYYDNVKAEFYVVYLLSGGVLLLLRPAFLIPFIPLLAKKMYNDHPIRWSVETYYSIEVASLLPLMAFMVIATLNNTRIKQSLSFLLPVAATVVTVYKMVVPPVNPIVGESFKYNVVKSDYYSNTFNVRELRELVNTIPDTASVSAGNRILPHLAFRPKAYYFPNVSDAEYIILLKSGDTYPLMPEEFEGALKQYRESPEWRVTQESSEALIFRRVTGN